jgi:hypothetical protein
VLQIEDAKIKEEATPKASGALGDIIRNLKKIKEEGIS